MTLTRSQWETVVKAILEAADADLGKEVDPEYAEEPDNAQSFLNELVEAGAAALRKTIALNEEELKQEYRDKLAREKEGK